MSLETKLNPPATKGHVSIADLRSYWYVACFSHELKTKPLARTLLGVPVVVYRMESGGVGALVDRCPHRNAPLSIGKVVGENLECGYHGWQFSDDGECQLVPGLCGPASSKGRVVDAYPTREQDGVVWVFMNHKEAPMRPPMRLPYIDDDNYTIVRKSVVAKGTVHAAIENALDVPHTAFLHAGLFRTDGDRDPIKVEVSRWADRVQAEYIGESRPEGLVGRLLSPSGGIVTHYDRFILPSIAQVEYKIGDENHILVTAACTPVSDFETVLHATVALRLRAPRAVVKSIVPLLTPFALRIFQQDAVVLEMQTANIQRFGGEQFVSTDIDVLGNEIWRLMKRAERGQVEEDAGEPTVRELTMMV